MQKPVILGEKATVLLWGFKLTLKDRRNGKTVDGYAVTSGNEDYDIDAAEKEIRDRAGVQGYTVVRCEYDDSRTYHYDAVEEYRNASKPTRCQTCDCYIPYDSSVGQQEGCILLESEEDRADIEEEGNLQTVEDCYKCGGRGCPCYDLATTAKCEPSDKPDYLSEVMAALEELEEGER